MPLSSVLSILVQLSLAISFVILVCVATYKLTLPLALKIIDLCKISPFFRKGACIFFAIVFFITGLFQLKDFLKEIDSDLTQFFPLTLLAAGIFLFLGLQNQKRVK